MQPIYLFPDAFSETETRRYRALAEAAGFEPTGNHYPPGYRNNDRVVLDSDALAAEVLERIRPLLPVQRRDSRGRVWRLYGLNRRFRFCRYRDGQSFDVHRDGVHHVDARTRSMLTFMIYLNDSDEFRGGQTRFFTGRDRAATSLTVEPRRGTLIVFDHALWHQGDAVHGGTKMIMRSDVLYELDEASLGAEERGHSGYVWCLARTPDGQVASGGRDGTVRLWRVGQGGELIHEATHDGYRGSVSALAITGDGTLWSGGRDGVLYRRRGDSLTVNEDAHPGAILALRALDDGRVASAGADGTIRLWSPDGQRFQVLEGHRSWVWDLSVRSDGMLVSGSEDGQVRLWSLATGAPCGVIGAGGPVRSVEVLRDWRIAVGLDDGELRLYEGASLHTRLAAHDAAISAIAELADGSIATASEDGTCQVWSAASLEPLTRDAHDDFVTDVLALPDGRYVTASYDAAVQVRVRPDRSRPSRNRWSRPASRSWL
jgi:hypothetical protein